MKKANLNDLLEAGCHFGHQAKRWHPKAKPFLFDKKDGVHIFDLVKTKEQLEKAAQFLYDLAFQDKVVVFVGCKRQAQAVVTEEAKRAGMPYVTNRWLGGTLTNWQQIGSRVRRLKKLKEQKEAGELKKYTKREQLDFDREITKLDRIVGGLQTMEDLPDGLLVVDIVREEVAIKEAKQAGIPVVAIVDSNSDPSLVDYPIPANDDAVGSIKFIVSFLADAITEGRKAGQKKTEKKTKPKEKSGK